MKSNYKIIALMLSVIIAFSMLSCGDKPNSNIGSSSTPNSSTSTSSTETEKTPLTLAETTAILDKSPYTSSDLNENYGLSDSTDVGVIQANLEQDKVEMPQDSYFDSQDILNFEQMTGSSDSVKMDNLLLTAKDKFANDKNVKIVFPNRQIEISQSAMNEDTENHMLPFNNFDELYIEGGENTLIMIEVASSWVGGFNFQNGEKLVIENVKVDYLYASTFTGVVKHVDESSMKITMTVPSSMNDQFDFAVANPDLYKNLYSMIEFNRYTNAPDEKGIVLIASEGFFDSVLLDDSGEERQIVVTLAEGYKSSFKSPMPGQNFALGFTMYGNAVFVANVITTVEVQDFTTYHNPGMAITATKCQDIIFNRVNILKNRDRFMTATADGMHIASCTGEVEITNCILENTHDDALNIKSGYYYNLSNFNAVTKEIIITKKTSEIEIPKAGDEIAVYKQNSFETIAVFTVVSASGNSSNYTLKVKERISGQMDLTGCVVTNLTNSAKLTFANNIVQNKRNRGILVQVREAEIVNNYFTNVGHGAISVHSSLDVFNEATMPQNVVIANNKLINNGYYLSLRGDISVFAIAEGGTVAPSGTISNIEVENNYIKSCGNAGVSFRGVGGKDSGISYNLFYNASRVNNGELTDGCVELVNVNDISIVGNYNHYTLNSEIHCGIIPSGTTNQDTLTVENNYNFDYQNLSGDTVNTNVSKVNSSDISLDGNIDEWESIGNNIAMNGSSLATGDSILSSQYQNEFGVETAKIAWTEDGIYLAYKVKDNKFDFKNPVSFWTGDIVEIFMSNYLSMPNADFQVIKEEGELMQLALSPTYTNHLTCGDTRTSSKIVENISSIKSKIVAIEDTSYTGELFLPFSLFTEYKANIDNGEPIAMAIVFADSERDDIDRTRLQISNVPHFVETYKLKTAKMPIFTFVE